MVANDRVERPDSPDFLRNKIRELEEKIDALTRQSKFPFSIGHNGIPDFEVLPDPADPSGGAKVRILNGNGVPVFETFYSTVYNGKTARLNDLAGNAVWGQDEAAGYGMSHPSITYPAGVTFQGTPSATLTGGTAYTIAKGGFMFYHPVLWFKGLVTTPLNWTLRCRVLDGSGTEAATSTSTPTQSGSQYFERMVLLPPSVVGAQNCSAEIVLTPASSGSVQLWPQPFMGTTLGYYNVRTDVH
ncbi:hypothetical protein [Amycolatopsis rubida]|uniref:Uncharacterized protein n=1 Tax=Amycolatopsis rubida TaxID=112413 RepID=A0A1I5IG68_9PSEU|nr:hypothetical protein [Amycolatopsis rubida]SFO59553.1 hypothetical protein SAMN05421854_102453 [Amycolatopsis rubida]